MQAYIKELNKANAPWGYRNLVSEDKDGRLVKESKEKTAGKPPKVFHTIILVATLVATVTFAASFTVPGGFDDNQGPNEGMAVLVRKAAFKAYVISNTIAVTFSISALILLLVTSYHQTSWHTWVNNISRPFTWGWNFLIVSLVAMMVSLITGSFAVLANSMGLVVSVCAIGCVGFLIFWVSLCGISFDIMYAMYTKFHFNLRYWPVVMFVSRIANLFSCD